MSATLISECTYTAKKKHVCDLCGQHIQIGDNYLRQFCIDGHAYAFKSHLVCNDIANHFQSENDYEDGYDLNCFSYDVFENFESVTGRKSEGLKYQEAINLFKESWILKNKR